VKRCFKSKAGVFVRKNKVIVDRFRNVHDRDVVVTLGKFVRKVRRPLSTDNDQLVDVMLTESLHQVLYVFLVLERIESRGSEDGASFVVDIAGVVWGQIDDGAWFTHGEVSESVDQALDREPTVMGFDDA
jgi:hypothetical protein